VRVGIRRALKVGSVVAEVVAIEARLAAVELNELGFERQPAPVEESMPKVVSLTQRRLADPAAVIASLPQDTRPPTASKLRTRTVPAGRERPHARGVWS
jgi:hypothetical protein